MCAMRCYDCATEGKAEEALGICVVCGRAVCLTHSRLQRVPQFRKTEGGIGGPYVRCAQDKARLVCRECGGDGEQNCETKPRGA